VSSKPGAGHLHESEIKQRVDTLTAQKENLAGSIKAAEQRLAGEQSTANYLAAALPLQLSRVEVARKLFQRKLFETHCPGGALKYDEQIAPLLRSAEHDVAHALARLAAVSEGMHDLFGYSDLFPITGGNRPPDLDDCDQWARDAINWMRTFAGRDEMVTIPISLKRVMGDHWNAGLKNRTWEFSFGTSAGGQIWDEMLRDRRYCRVRGVSAFVNSPNIGGEWQLNIQLPTKSAIRYKDNSMHDLPEQAKLPSSWLGRVATKNNNRREPEIVGATTLLNASPLGLWRVRILDRSADGLSLADPKGRIDDIIIELTLAAQSVLSG